MTGPASPGVMQRSVLAWWSQAPTMIMPRGRTADGPSRRQARVPASHLCKWRRAREATVHELCAAFVDRAHAENLAAATERYYRQTTHRWLRFCAQQGLIDPREVSPHHLTDNRGWL